MRAFRVFAVVLAATLALTACSSGEQDTLAADYRDGSGQDYVSGDGAYTFLAESSRQDPIEFSGQDDLGGEWSSTDYSDSVILVNFWYAGCPPCRVEAPDLVALHQEFSSQGVQFVGINVYDQAATARTFADEFGIDYPSILDVDSGLARLAFAGQITPNAVPVTLVLDREHRVAARVSGLITDVEVLRTMIRDVLAEN